MARSKAYGQGRRPRLEKVTKGTFEGTSAIVEAVIVDSVGVGAWRPVRAAAFMAMQTRHPPKGHVWMTVAEFNAFLARFFPTGTKASARLMPEVGITKYRRRAIQTGEGLPISKGEALACAHYAAGLPMPVPADDAEAFAEWVSARFGHVTALTESLGFAARRISDRMKGYVIGPNSERLERLPDPTTIRAVDWAWRVGPFCPYGDRLPAPPFPQEETP